LTTNWIANKVSYLCNSTLDRIKKTKEKDKGLEEEEAEEGRKRTRRTRRTRKQGRRH